MLQNQFQLTQTKVCKMKENRKNQLLLSFQKVLLFNITFHTKLIVANVFNSSKLVIWVYMDKLPTDDEKDVYYSICAEVTGEFLDLDDSISEVHFLTESFAEENLKDKLLLFARCDYLDLEGNLK